jgi:uncharacterized protein (UPF0276 family)
VSFLERAAALPRLGLGVSTEYGARQGDALDPVARRRRNARWGGFLELGVELEKGLDADARAWVAAGLPTTWHFLDINLEDEADFDPGWVTALQKGVAETRPAWLCGDAGLWHFGRRERGHMLLLPPILSDAGADAMAVGVRRLRSLTGLEVLPENPPGVAWVGDRTLLQWLARLAEVADTGVLLDLAHLAMYQEVHGRDPLDGLAEFPAERIVELHIAGGEPRDTDGLRWTEDTHGTDVRPAVWRALDALLPRMTNLKAVVVECERNAIDAVVPLYAEVERRLRGWA